MTAPARLIYGASYWDLLRSMEIAGISLRESSYAEGFQLPPHCHLRAGFHLVITGGYTEIAKSGREEYGPRNVAYLPATHEHRLDIAESGARCFCIELHPRYFARLPEEVVMPDQSLRLVEGSIPFLMSRIFQEFVRMDPFSPLAIESLAIETIVEFARAEGESIDPHPPLWLLRARELLHSRYDQSLGATEIAQEVGVHPGHLARAFRAHYRCTAGEYLRRVRIESACQSLIHSQKAIGDIALETGFADQSHFCRTFRRLTGSSPAQFRQAMRS